MLLLKNMDLWVNQVVLKVQLEKNILYTQKVEENIN